MRSLCSGETRGCELWCVGYLGTWYVMWTGIPCSLALTIFAQHQLCLVPIIKSVAFYFFYNIKTLLLVNFFLKKNHLIFNMLLTYIS